MSYKDRSNILFLVLAYLYNSIFITPLQAQIIPDSSLGDRSSVITPNVNIKDRKADLIEGGAIRENNLFHSFSEFNIGNDNAVYFASPDGIANIFTRVTGNNLSEIFGTLGVDGAANLFLLNPNGIIFGDDAALDVNGSFLGTTADSYIFDNGFAYSASSPEQPSLLTVNIPVGIQFGSGTGQIINRSRFTNSSDDTIRGLNISPQQTLSLIGGEVLMEGGYLSTSQGNIIIGSVAPQNKANLLPSSQGWTLDYQGINNFGNITIDGGGKIDGGVMGASNITLTGKNIALGHDLQTITDMGYDLDDFFTLQPLPKIDELSSNSGHIFANNQDNLIPSQISLNASETFSMISEGSLAAATTGTGNAGKIDINSDTAVIYGSEFDGNSLENSSGNAGVVRFNADRMSVQNGGGGVNTSGSGNGGAIDLNIAGDLKIQFGGFGADTFSSGNGGKIEIDANNLEVISGGAGVNTLGSGNGGTIDLNIANELKVRFGGFGADTVSTGDGGKIEIDTKILDMSFGGIGVNARNIGKGGQIQVKAETILLESAGISAESGQDIDISQMDFDINQLRARFGQRDAGDGGIISIEADYLFLNDGGQISTTTFGTGHAGIIDLQVDYLQLKGNRQTNISSSTNASGDGGNIEIFSDRITIAEEASITANSHDIGNAGDISLNAKNIIQLQDRGDISVDGGIKGRSGNIDLTSSKIHLSDESSISAKVNLGDRGNIILTANNLFLEDLSKITTNATDNSIGGNIFIDIRDNLVTQARSQIVSNAVEGRGGNIEIQTRAFFVSPNSAIEASSEFGIDGTVRVNTFELNPNSDPIQLPNQLIDSSHYLTRGCGTRSKYSFINVGRVGLPENPLNTISNIDILADLEIPEDTTKTGIESIQEPLHGDDFSTGLIIEAQSWKTNQQGIIELIASTSKSDRFLLPLNRYKCSQNTKNQSY